MSINKSLLAPPTYLPRPVQTCIPNLHTIALDSVNSNNSLYKGVDDFSKVSSLLFFFLSLSLSLFLSSGKGLQESRENERKKDETVGGLRERERERGPEWTRQTKKEKEAKLIKRNKIK